MRVRARNKITCRFVGCSKKVLEAVRKHSKIDSFNPEDAYSVRGDPRAVENGSFGQALKAFHQEALIVLYLPTGLSVFPGQG